jgi:hypothetical protein
MFHIVHKTGVYELGKISFMSYYECDCVISYILYSFLFQQVIRQPLPVFKIIEIN